MQRIARKILQILDGTPAVYGKPQKGQSLAEMAFITPLILILIAGIVEIGWLANNYLTLQEVSKVGARRGTTLVGQYSPLEWNDLYTTVPADYIGGGNIDPIDVIDPVDLPERQTLREAVRTCDAFVQAEYPGFYNEILCVMLDSMEPLQIRGGSGVESEDDWNGIDDIAISVFAIENVHYATYTGTPFEDVLAGGLYDNTNNGEVDFATFPGPIVTSRETFERDTWNPVVVGRYPTFANECNVAEDGALLNPPPERDPFDYINDGILTEAAYPVNNNEILPFELARLEVVGGVEDWVPAGLDPYTQREQQRGFVFTGQQRLTELEGEDVNCYGSEFSIYDIQELMLVPRFQMTDAELAQARNGDADFGFFRQPDGTRVELDVRQFLPSQGLVLVEIWWQHDLLLDLPVYNPVFNALGDDQTTLYVWAAFPAPQVEPRIQYFLSND